MFKPLPVAPQGHHGNHICVHHSLTVLFRACTTIVNTVTSVQCDLIASVQL